MNTTHEQKKEREEIFWRLITDRVIEKMEWDYPVKWNKAKAIDLQEDMEKVLLKRRSENSKISRLCRLDTTKSPFKNYPMTSSILSIFHYKTTRTTREYIKNRFSFYVANMPAEDFLKKNGFPKNPSELSVESNKTIWKNLTNYIVNVLKL